MTTTWTETDALASQRATDRRGAELAAELLAYEVAFTAARRAGATTAEAHEAGLAARTAETEVAEVPAQRDETPAADIVCTEGSCLHARPGTVCDCTSCYGADHGAKSTLAPAACAGTRVLVERNRAGAGYVYPRCPGCADCRRPRLVLVASR